MTGKFSREVSPTSTVTENYEGGKAYSLDPKTELYERVATCLVKEPKFYGKVEDESTRILELIKIVLDQDPVFVLRLAAYARNVLYLRSIPVLLLTEAGLAIRDHVDKDHTLTYAIRKFAPSIVKRADELIEVISYVISKIGKLGDEEKKTMLPHSIQKGLKTAFYNFNDYGFSKYDRVKSAVSMQDVIRLVHPKPRNDAEKELYRKIAKDELESAETWETITMKEGSSKETWEKAVGKMPYMAMLRNLRNLLDKQVSMSAIDYVISKLTTEKAVLNSKQFPYRFVSAYKELEDNSSPYTGDLLTAIESAIEISVQNVPEMGGITAVFSDNSGSMTDTVSSKSKIQRMEVAAILAAIMSKKGRCIAGVFGESFQSLNFAKQDPIVARSRKMANTNVGHSTNAYLAIKYLNEMKIRVERILIFSDMQCYDADYKLNAPHYSAYGQQTLNEEWLKYRQNVNPGCYLYSFDLAGYGTSQFPQNDNHVMLVAGWSENVLKYIPEFERDRTTVIDNIQKITPDTYLRLRDA